MISLPSWNAISAARPGSQVTRPVIPYSITLFEQGANHFRIPERRGLSQRQEYPLSNNKRAERIGLRPSRNQ
jgi:hypothetical protein